MPFGSRHAPSIQICTLKSYARAQGFEVDTLSAHLLFAERLGAALCDRLDPGPGEPLFSRLLFPEMGEAVDQNLGRTFSKEEAALLKSASEGFVEELLERVPWTDYRVVGFTSSYSQNLASLLLAKRVKERFPDTHIVFGGANCDSDMGRSLVGTFEFIDSVVDGEGELSLVGLLAGLRNGHWKKVPGLVFRESGRVRANPRPPRIADLDALPFPDYSEYFDRLEGLKNVSPNVSIPIESSRGCWWARCTFCSLQPSGDKCYFSKSPARVVSEIEHQVKKHRVLMIQFQDSVPHARHLDGLLSGLETLRERMDLRCFFEVRANMKRAQFERLANAGINNVQIGVESFSDRMLKVMNKGATALHNVSALKWCEEFGFSRVDYNILSPFPRETPADVCDTLELFESCSHLPPPTAIHPFLLEPFSTIFGEPSRYGLRNVRQAEEYAELYPKPVRDQLRLYYYAFDYDHDLGRAEGYRALREARNRWAERYRGHLVAKRKGLSYTRGDDFIVIDDFRFEQPRQITLEQVQADVYEACEAPASVRTLAEKFPSVEEAELLELLENFVQARLMIRSGNAFLALAVRARSDQPVGAAWLRTDPIPEFGWSARSEVTLDDGRGGRLEGAFAPFLLERQGSPLAWCHVSDREGVELALFDVVDRAHWKRRGKVVFEGPGGAAGTRAVGRPWVLTDGGGFRAWYDVRDGRPRQVCWATSDDGLVWLERGVVVETGNGVGRFDAFDPCVLRDEEGRFRLWYAQASSEGAPSEIFHAISDDGESWKDHRRVLGQTSFEPLGVGFEGARAPCVVVTPHPGGARFRMWASVKRNADAYVALFSSADGLDWVSEKLEVALTMRASHAGRVLFPFVVAAKDGLTAYYSVNGEPLGLQVATRR